MKKTIILLFVSILTVPWILWYGLGTAVPSLQKKCSFDLNENRNVYDLEDGVEKAYNDRIPFRTGLVHTYNQWNHKADERYQKGLENRLISLLYHEDTDEEVNQELDGLEWLIYGEDFMTAGDHIHDFREGETVEPTLDAYGYTTYICNVCEKEYKMDFVAKQTDSSYMPIKLNDNTVCQGRGDWLFGFNKYSWCKYYTGESLYEEESLNARAKSLQRIQAWCDANGVEFVYMIVPAKCTVYPEYMPTLDVESDYSMTNQVVDYIKEHTDVNVIFPEEELRYSSRLYQTYFRYDTHWNEVGAFVGCQSLHHALGEETTPLYDLEIKEDTEKETKSMDILPMMGLSRSDFDTPDYDFEISYKTDVKLDCTKEDLEKDIGPIMEISSDGDGDKNMVFIGDSFRVMPARYLAKDYKKSTIAHFYSFDGDSYNKNYGCSTEEVLSELKKAVKDTDVLVFEITEANEFMAPDYLRVLADFLD